MPTTVIHCNSYNCRHISKVGNLCCAESVDMVGTICKTFKREEKGDKVYNPRCYKQAGKWVADHHNVLK